MIWMVLLGVMAFLIGGLLIVSPNTLLKISDPMSRMITRIDEQVIKNRVGVGICLIGAGAFLLFTFYLLHYRLGR
jgi:hypothetical protein